MKKILFILIICSSLFANSGEKYWIYFTDKGNTHLAKSSVFEGYHPKALSRRARVNQNTTAIEFTDLPVSDNYLTQLEKLKVKTVVKSKWLNAVSAILDENQLEQVSKLSFVKKVVAVNKGRRPVRDFEKPLLKSSGLQSESHVYDYGNSLPQYEQINLLPVHDAGFSGRGVRVAVLDNGFRLNHKAFSRLNVVGTWDFINGDEIVDNEPGQDITGQNEHGTKVLSVMAAFDQGELIGPAFNADYLLAKTEDHSSETEAEEDYWIAAAEWADQNGADIITTSLGYIDWYEYADLDGNTAPITIAADLAVKKGIVVVSSAGNEANDPWYYVTPPADGDSVLAVGSVDLNGEIVYFSSRGPTFDGRIKPEVCALGIGVKSVELPGSAGTSQEYTTVQGTSFSCPIVAGVAALILEAHPHLTPMQVYEAMISTASLQHFPNNNYGYGVVDCYRAATYWGEITVEAAENKIYSIFPNPFNPVTQLGLVIQVDVAEPAMLTIDIYNSIGEKVVTVAQGNRHLGGEQQIMWNGRNQAGLPVASGVYFCKITLGGLKETFKFTVLK